MRPLIRTLLGSAVVALILSRGTSLTPDPEAKMPVPLAAFSALAAPSKKIEIPPLPPATDAMFPRAAGRRTSVIEHCFTPGLDLNVPASPGQIALIDAALKQDWKAVLRMLDSGVLIEAADETGVTPLMAAAAQGNI